MVARSTPKAPAISITVSPALNRSTAELRRPSGLNSASLRTLPALTSARTDQAALELGKAAQDGEHARCID
jgi:hypothetical protein